MLDVTKTLILIIFRANVHIVIPSALPRVGKKGMSMNKWQIFVSMRKGKEDSSNS